MKKIICLLVLIFAAPINAYAMIINGGFEDPDIAPGTFSIFPAITGWTASSGQIEIQDNVAGSPFEGDQFLELDAFVSSTIYQDVSGLVAGQSYELSFAFSARANTSIPFDNVLSVKWDGVEIFNNQASTTNPIWTVHSAVVTASGSTNRLELSDVSPISNSLGVYLDDFQLTAMVPEPSIIALFGLGLLGLGFARRRKA